MIKIVCAWCGKVIREGAPGVKLIFPECFEEEMQRFEREEQGEKAHPHPPRFYKPSEP